MSSYAAHTDNTPPITTPGHLLANIPGLLGFYPTESVIFMAIDTTPRGSAMGPIARVDIADAQEALPDIAATLSDKACEGIFAFLVSHRPLEELEEISCWLYNLDRVRDGIDVDAAWYVREIACGEHYAMLHGTVNTDGSGPMKKWVEGTVPALTDAPTMRSLVDHNVVPELSREDFFSVFARGNTHVDALEAEALARQARDSATRLRACVAAATGAKRKELIDNFLDDVQWTLSKVTTVEEAAGDVDMLQTCAVWLSTTWTRDLVVGECAEAGKEAAHLLLAAARTFDGEIRANALTLFALAQLKLDWEIHAGPALQTVAEEFPSHRLGSLLCRAYRYGLHEKIRDTIRSGAHEAYNTAVGKTGGAPSTAVAPTTPVTSGVPSELARRAAG